MVLIRILLAASVVWAATPSSTERSPRFLVHLLDYLAKDYYGAIGHGGQVISASEYKEQQEFAASADATARELPELSDHADVRAGVARLVALIEQKGEPTDVSTLARSLQQQVIAITHLEVAPSSWPSLARGREVFEQNCVSCHGTTGKGDGPAAAAMTPKPANLASDEVMGDLAPLQGFNTVRLGVPGTGMPPFPALTDEDAWAVAFYIESLRYAEGAALASPPPGMAFGAAELKAAATTSDADLAKTLAAQGQAHAYLTALRLHSGGNGQSSSLTLARTLLSESLNAYREGRADAAKTLALQAYLDGIEPVEPRLAATDASAVPELEGRMSEIRGRIDAGAAPAAVAQAIQDAERLIDRAEELTSHKDIDATVAFTASSAILLREGFEAVLMILALLGVIRATGSRRAAWWVHGGWIAALAGGAVMWSFSGLLIDISGAQREMVEGVTSLLAVAILLSVGFWLHSRTEIGRWNHFLKVKVRAALDQRRLAGLAGIAFIAVFREAIETVLFLRAVWLDGGSAAKTAMATSVFMTIGLIIVGAWAVLRFSARVPVRKLFAGSAVVMGLLAFILTGKGLHSLQETGALGVSSAALPAHSDLLGIYPTWETLSAQAAVLALIAALWALGKRPTANIRG